MQISAESFLPPLARQLLNGKDRDLLQPASWVEPDTSPARGPRADAGARRELADALLERNQGWGHPAAEALCERFADPSTMVVATGQQAGLLCGPLYTVSKAIAAARWAQHLSGVDTDAVPIFWVATEDHDFAEVARCHLPVPGAEEAVLKELQPAASALLPVGGLVLGPQVDELFAELRERVDNPRYREWLQVVEECCSPESTFGEAFCRLLVRTLGDRCPLLLDAQEPALKRLERPWLKKLVECRQQVEQGLSDRESLIRSRGYRLQVKQQPGWSPLFLLDDEGQRRRIGWTQDDGFTLRGTEHQSPVSQLLEIIESEPERVSPGALSRPAIQDAVLGTAVSLLGPGEMSYMTQAAAVHQALGIEAPGLALRPQALVVDARRQRQMEQLSERGLKVEALLGPVPELELRLAELVGTPEIVETRDRLRKQVAEQLDGLLVQARELDPQLESACDKTRKQIDRALDALDARLNQALSRQDDLMRSRVEALRRLCLPGGVLQERTITSAHYPGLYGPGFVEALWRQLGLSPRLIHLVAPDAITTAERAGVDRP